MKREVKRVTAVTVIIATLILCVVPAVVAVQKWEPWNPRYDADSTSKYQKPDVNSLTGEGAEMRELASETSAYGVEKQWYEYVTYSKEPVGYNYISKYQRLAFYDPYDYADALIMKIGDVTTDSGNEWSSASSINISYQTGTSSEFGRGTEESAGFSSSVSDSISEGTEQGSSASSEFTHSTSEDLSLGLSESLAATASVEASAEVSNTVSIGSNASASVGVDGLSATVGASLEESVTASVSTSVSESATLSVGSSQVVSFGSGISDSYGSSVSSGKSWSHVAETTREVSGSQSTSYNSSWSTNDSSSISRTFDATHFNSAGVPYQWKIVTYTLYMPVYVELQIDNGDGWVTTDSCYCRLNTIQGTCRAWIQNNIVYYEHWGTSEPVVWDDFWSGYFSSEELLNAYKNCPWPEN